MDDGNGGQMPNRGQNVSVMSEKKLKMAVYYVKHKKRCSEAVTHADVTLVNVNTMKALYDIEKAHKDPEAVSDPKDILDKRDWNKSFETLDEHIEKHLGIDGVPLSYLLRAETAPADAPAGGWTDQKEKMIKRAPHFNVNDAGAITTTHTDSYKNDNIKLWNLVAGLTRDMTDAWTYVKSGQRQKDGRLAYMTLKAHFLGRNYQQSQQTIHENILRNTTYHGEQKKMNFQKYSTRIYDSLQALNGMKADGYNGVDARSAVRFLTDGIKDTSLDATKNMIWADNNLRGDFTACVQLFQDFINQRSASDKGKSLNISEVDTKKKDKDKKRLRQTGAKKGNSGVDNNNNNNKN